MDPNESAAWNPRYLLYCASQGFPSNPMGMQAEDRRRWPGGRMAGFTVWISEQVHDFRQENPAAFLPGKLGALADQKAFDAFLNNRFAVCMEG